MSSILHSTPSLINIGTHSLALYSHGPQPSSSLDPVVWFVSGVASSRLNWAAVIRLLPPSMRSYTYDRSGFGSSELSPLKPTAENIAKELFELIKNTSIVNPLILVGHSWAGVLVNEFLYVARDHTRIAGLVLVDANHESTLQVLDPNDAALQAISEGIEPYSGRGITEEHKLTPKEWEAYMSDEATEKAKLQAQKEDHEYVPSFETLRKKELANFQPLVGNKPIYVIGGMRSRDWSRLYNRGVDIGNGTEEQRSQVKSLIKTADEKSAGLMKEHLMLSRKGKLVFAHQSGHFVQLTQPNIVVDGVEWVLGNSQVSMSV